VKAPTAARIDPVATSSTPLASIGGTIEASRTSATANAIPSQASDG
jgi:hypothetical protein